MNDDFKDTYPTFIGCQDSCHQGRKRCPTPQACEMPEEEADRKIERVFWVVVVMIYAIIFASIL